jgi:chromosome segregation ATPase
VFKTQLRSKEEKLSDLQYKFDRVSTENEKLRMEMEAILNENRELHSQNETLRYETMQSHIGGLLEENKTLSYERKLAYEEIQMLELLLHGLEAEVGHLRDKRDEGGALSHEICCVESKLADTSNSYQLEKYRNQVLEEEICELKVILHDLSGILESSS